MDIKVQKTTEPFPWLSHPSAFQRFCRNPAVFLAHWLHNRRVQYSCDVPHSTSSTVSIVCLSDTHGNRYNVPDSDLLLHAGDLTVNGSFKEIQDQLDWIDAMPHRYKVVIAGNHDLLLDSEFTDKFPNRVYAVEGSERSDLRWGSIIYLNNSAVTLDFSNGRKIKIYGSAWTPQFGNWAFQYPPIRDVWTNTIPSDTDILLTHGPPKGYLDLEGKGCGFLLQEIWQQRPRLAVFGHLHAGRGQQDLRYSKFEHTYGQILVGNVGFWGAVVMVFCLIFENLRAVLAYPLRWRYAAHTTFINAASIRDSKGREVRPPIITEI